jgi:pyruvate,water dikinase
VGISASGAGDASPAASEAAATPEGAAFPVHFDDPADAQRCWHFSAEHMPNALTPLEFELGLKRFLEGFGWGMVPRQFNHFVYFALQPSPGQQAPVPATPDSLREAGRRWHEEVLPEVLTLTEHYRETDFAALANEALAAEIERLPEVRFRAGQLHTLAVRPHWEGMNLLIGTYKELTGGDDLGALRLVQGYPNKSFESGAQLWQVSRLAGTVPLVRERLRALEAPTARATLDALRSEPPAAPFVEAFDGYLEAYGWRSNGGFASPTWAEDPTVPLTLLRAYLQTDGYDPNAEQRRLIEEREAAERETLAALDGEGRSRLQDAIDAARAVAPLLEDHNFYIDQRLATLPRRLVMTAAGRLDLANPNDVFFLHTDELCGALRGATADVSALAEERKQDFKRWRDVAPPPYVGAAPPGGLARAAPAAGGRDGQTDELRGSGASAGVARGPARILRGLHEADRLRPGDILVTQVTQPAWTPLFAVARAVVTEVGGVLSHTAVAAREYGIPAVVAVPNAPRLLRDGALIEVDGSAGVVRVVG